MQKGSQAFCRPIAFITIYFLFYYYFFKLFIMNYELFSSFVGEVTVHVALIHLMDTLNPWTLTAHVLARCLLIFKMFCTFKIH